MVKWWNGLRERTQGYLILAFLALGLFVVLAALLGIGFALAFYVAVAGAFTFIFLLFVAIDKLDRY